MSTVRKSTYFTDYNKHEADEAEATTTESTEFVIPEDLSDKSVEELSTLLDEAVAVFDEVYGEGTNLSDADVEALAVLTEGVERIKTVMVEREEAASKRAEKAAELAAKVKVEKTVEVEEEAETVEEEDEVEDEAEEPAPDPVTASGELRVKYAKRARKRVKTEDKPGMSDFVHASGDGGAYAAGSGLDWDKLGKAVNHRLTGFNLSQYQAASGAQRHLRQQFGIATIQKPLRDDLRIMSNDQGHVEDVLQNAVNEKRLNGGSLTAAGGWGAPSQTLYDLLEIETRDGLFSLPEVGVVRGGFSRTLGPDFADIFANLKTFSYTEAEDIAGDYDGEGAGSKPFYRVTVPEFEEFRLDAVGMGIVAGLLLRRGYPEAIERTIRAALVAHDFNLATRALSAIKAGSDAVTFPETISGTSSILSAVELQAEAVRHRTRISRTASLEAIFPAWVIGAMRADLSRRNGVDYFSVTDAQVTAWLRARGVNPQFVYGLNDLDESGGKATAWPTEIEFLMYPAGTWVRGTGEVITLDTIFDSVLLGKNDYIALFTEEGFLVTKMGHESRSVTVPFAVDGVTGAQILADASGAPVAAEPGV